MSLSGDKEGYLTYPRGFPTGHSGIKYEASLLSGGVVQVVISVLSLIIGAFALFIYVLNTNNYDDFMVISSALWCFPWFMTSGILSIQASKPGRNKKVTASLVLSVFSIVFSGFMITLEIVATLYSWNILLMSMHGLLAVLGVIELCTAITQTVFCSKKICCVSRNVVSPSSHSYPSPVAFQTVQIPVYHPKSNNVNPNNEAWDP